MPFKRGSNNLRNSINAAGALISWEWNFLTSRSFKFSNTVLFVSRLLLLLSLLLLLDGVRSTGAEKTENYSGQRKGRMYHVLGLFERIWLNPLRKSRHFQGIDLANLVIHTCYSWWQKCWSLSNRIWKVRTDLSRCIYRDTKNHYLYENGEIYSFNVFFLFIRSWSLVLWWLSAENISLFLIQVHTDLFAPLFKNRC